MFMYIIHLKNIVIDYFNFCLEGIYFTNFNWVSSFFLFVSFMSH